MIGPWMRPGLRRWIDSDDRKVLEAAFRILPSWLFANLKPAIVERWSRWSGFLGARATSVLVECAFDELRPLLAQHVERGLLDLEKTAAVISSLIRLPRLDAQELLDEAAGAFSLSCSGRLMRSSAH